MTRSARERIPQCLALSARSALATAKESFVLLGAGLLLAVATALPSRVALASWQATGLVRSAYIAGGLLSDVAILGPAVVALLVLLATGARVRRRWFDVGLAGLVTLLTVALLAQNAATEFRFERGVLPGPIDAREGLSHGDFLAAELPLLLSGRFLWVNLVSVVVTFLVVRSVRRRVLGLLARRASHVRGLMLLGAAASVAMMLGARAANAYCARLHNQDAIASPSATLLSGLVAGDTYDGSPFAVRRLLLEAPASPTAVAAGAQNLGFSPDAAAQIGLARASGRCSPHPLARALAGADGAVEAPLVAAARSLSKEIFRERDIRPIVFHVSLESMRADDVHAIVPDAPTELAPFLSEIYSDNADAAAFRFAHQSGVRTAHALSGVICGLGALPFNLALGRDLGSLPLRCMPDVLADAGFTARAFYGHEFMFDDMGTFLRSHGMTLHERADFAPSAPRGVWRAVTDDAVYRSAMDAAESSAAPQYNFVLTLSHHTPYPAPDDLAPASRDEIRRVCASRELGGENCDRLLTLRYSDDALRHFVDRVSRSKDAGRTIVVVSADHTTHQWVPWGKVEHAEGITQIPVFVWLPEALRSGAKDPTLFQGAWSRFRALSATTPISNSDVPTLVLALTGESAPVRAMAPVHRWHTLGGQATSPFYRSPLGHGIGHGVDAHGNLFAIGEDGATHPSGLPMETLRGRSDVSDARPHNASELAFLGAFLRDYVAVCPPDRPHGAPRPTL